MTKKDKKEITEQSKNKKIEIIDRKHNRSLTIVSSKNKRYIAVFLIKEQETYTVLTAKRFFPSKSIVRFKDNTYVITINKPTYSKGMKLFFFIDITEGQLNFDNTKKSNINPKTIDMILSQKIITELTDNLSGSFKMNLYNIIIGMLIGGLSGFIIGGYV